MQAVGTSQASVGRSWRSHGLKPHLVKTFQLSNDPHFAEKLEEIIGLYVSPPEHAIVFCCDEKSQVQALATSGLIPSSKLAELLPHVETSAEEPAPPPIKAHTITIPSGI